MDKLLKYISIMLLTWCIPGALAWAEQDQGKAYWVVGSFRNLDTAARQAERITAETGVETRYLLSTVAGVDYYRLLVAHTGDPDNLAKLTLQLDNAGVRDPWSIRVDENQTRSLPLASESQVMAIAEQVNTPEQVQGGEPVWLVVGSFTDYSAAQDMVEEILVSLGFIPELRDFVVGTQSVIRVLAGPYLSRQELDEARNQLQAAGYANSWPLQADSAAVDSPVIDYTATELDLMDFSRDDDSSAAMQQHRTQMIRQSRDSIKQPENTIRPGFNLATLRKRED